MISFQFITLLSETYNEPMTKENGKDNLKLKFIKKWLDDQKFTEQQISIMAERVIKEFIPTSVNPCPLIPHIIDICEIETTDKSKAELARTVSDNIIWAVLNIGGNEEGCRERAKTYIGELGTEVVKRLYGKWYIACNYIHDGNLETIRAQLRDSIVAHINRKEKGIADQPAEMEDLKINSYRTGEVTKLSDIIDKKALVFE